MSCEKVNTFISAYLDEALSGDDRATVAQHLAQCRECGGQIERHRQTRAMLRQLTGAAMPPELAGRLRVVASHERERRLARFDWATRLENLGERLRLFTDNLMRPLALPFAGGLVSAVMLFSMLVVPQFSGNAVVSDDVPTMLTTEATVKSALSFGLADDDIVVDVLVDESGRMLDYWVPDGQQWAADPQLRRSIEKTLVCTQFTPATMFGQPASGKLRITLRRSHVEVKG